MSASFRSKRPGQEVRTPYLLAQARYFVTRVSGDTVVSKRLGTGFLKEFESNVARLETLQDLAVQAKLASRQLSLAVDRHAAHVVAWIRGFRRLYAHARVHDAELPALPSGPPRESENHSKLALVAANLAGHGHKQVDKLAAYGIDAAFLEKGRRLSHALVTADQRQEDARRTLLPEAYQSLREMKSIVHEAVKRIVVIARSEHEGDRVKAREYSLRILYHGLPSAAPAPPAAPETGVA